MTSPICWHLTQNMLHALTMSVTHHVAATMMMSQDPQAADEYALHGNAFNPDTGESAKFGELSCSSDGHLWLAGFQCH